MADDEVALMQQLHDEHAGALWGYCLRLTGYDPSVLAHYEGEGLWPRPLQRRLRGRS